MQATRLPFQKIRLSSLPKLHNMALGIDNIKKAVRLSVDFIKQIEQSTSDGFQITDLFSFVDELSRLPEVIANRNQLVDELKDLSAEERMDLQLFVINEFDIANDKAEAAIESALCLVISLISLITALKK